MRPSWNSSLRIVYAYTHKQGEEVKVGWWLDWRRCDANVLRKQPRSQLIPKPGIRPNPLRIKLFRSDARMIPGGLHRFSREVARPFRSNQLKNSPSVRPLPSATPTTMMGIAMPQPEIPIERFEIFANGLDHPECVAFDRAGILWAGGEAGQVYRIDPAGKVVTVATLGGFTGGVALSPLDHAAYVRNPAHGVVPGGAAGSLRGVGRPTAGRDVARRGRQSVRRLLRLRRNLADLTVAAEDAARLGPFRDPDRPAHEPGLGRRESRRALRRQPRPVHGDPRPFARRPRPETCQSALTMRLNDKIAIVTGAAHGIGRAIAELFAEEGAWVLVADLDDGAGEAAAASIRGRGGRAVFRHVDVAEEVQVTAAADEAAEAGRGRI